MGLEAARLYTTVGMNTAPLQRGSRQAEAITKRTATSVTRVAAGIGLAFGGLRIGQMVGREVTAVDRSLRATNSLFGVTGRAAERSYKQMSAGARNLSQELGVAQSTLTDGLYEAISAGVPKDNAIDFLRIASKAAIAGVTDTRVAVDALSTATNSFKQQGLDAQRAADVMFQTVNLGKVEFPQLARYIGEASSFVATAGVRFDDFGAAIATMTGKGIKVPQTMTAIKQSMVSVMKPTDAMQKAYRKLGVRDWGELLKRSGSLQASFQALAKTTGGNNRALIEMFGSVDAVQAVLQLTGANAKDANTHLASVRNTTGATGRAFTEMNKSTGRALEEMKVRAMNAGMSFANEVLPMFTSGVTRLSIALDDAMRSEGFKSGVRDLGSAISTVGSVVGPVVVQLASLGAQLASNRTLVVGLASAYAGAKVAAMGFAAASSAQALINASLIGGVRSLSDAFLALRIAVISNPIGALAVAAGVAGAALYAFSQRSDGTEKAMKSAATAARDLYTAMNAVGNENVQAKDAAIQLTIAHDAARKANVAAAAATDKYGASSKQAKAANQAAALAMLALETATLRKSAADASANQAAIDAAGKVKEHSKALREAEALVKSQSNKVDSLAAAYAKVVKQGNAMTPSGRMLRSELDKQKKKLDDASSAADRERSALSKLGAQFAELGPPAASAAGAIKGLGDQIRNLPDTKTSRVNVVTSFTQKGSPLQNGPNFTYPGGKAPKIGGDKRGRIVRGPGTGTSDSVLSWLSDGEAVVPAASTRANHGALDWMIKNPGRHLPAYRNGKLPRGRKPGKNKNKIPAYKPINTEPIAAGDIGRANNRADQSIAGLTDKQKAAKKALDNAIQTENEAKQLLPSVSRAAAADAKKVTDLEKRLAAAKTPKARKAIQDALGNSKRGARGAAKASADRKAKYEEILRNAQQNRGQYSDDYVQLGQQIKDAEKAAEEAKEQDPIDKADDAYNSLKSDFSNQRAALDIALAKAEGTADTKDDEDQRTKLRELAAQEAGAYSSFLTGNNLTKEQQTQVMQDIATALRASLEDKSGDGVSGTTATGAGGELGALFQRATGSGAADGGDVQLVTTGGDGGGMGYTPDPETHPVFVDGNQINSLDFFDAMQGILITSVGGWDEAEIVEYGLDPRTTQDGEIVREMLMRGNVLNIGGIVSGSSKADVETKFLALRAKLQPTGQDDEVILKLPDPTYSGVPSLVFAESMDGYLRRSVRVVGSPTRGQAAGKYAFTFTCQLRSSHPQRFSDVQQSNTSGSVATGGGFTFDMAFPLDFGDAVTGGTVECVNAGNFKTPGVLTIAGPVTNPVVEQLSGGSGFLNFNAAGGLVVAVGDTLVVDLQARTVLLNGDSEQDRSKYLDPASKRWFLIPKGSSSFRLRGSVVADPASLNVAFRDAYL